MDSYPATLVQHERLDSGGDAPGRDDAPGDDDIGFEPAPAVVGQDERRMQVRAYNLWTSLLGQRNLPRIEDMAVTDLPDFAQNAVMLDFSDGSANPAITMLGERLAQECDAAEPIERLSDVPPGSLLSRITDHYRHVFANQAPVGFEAEFVNRREKTVVYRGILLPFASDGEIRHVLGVINWKELADPTITAGLIKELDKAALARTPFVPLGEWADGPAATGYADLDGAALAHIALAEWDLPDWLASARELACAARGAEERSRAALDQAIGRAWDLTLATEAMPQAFESLGTDAGLRADARMPMMPLVKLVFGGAYDANRLKEFALALTHAQRQGLAAGMLADYLAQAPGGLKGVVSLERKLSRKGQRHA